MDYEEYNMELETVYEKTEILKKEVVEELKKSDDFKKMKKQDQEKTIGAFMTPIEKVRELRKYELMCKFFGIESQELMCKMVK